MIKCLNGLPVDGELSQPEQRHLLVRMENEETLRERVCDLRNTKEWVKFSFDAETAPTRSLPGGGTRPFGG